MTESSPPDEEGLDLARMVAGNLIGRTPRQRPRSLSAEIRREQAPRSVTGDDLVTVDESMSQLVSDQGWGTQLAVHGVFSRWNAIMGNDVAAHCKPESFAEGKLLISADSTAWATQLRLMAADVVRRLNEVLGEGTVLEIDVRGPNAPSWKRGRLSVRGRGPRDTYG
ncbi:MAG TPA: DciA family protein [Marmoricola sp.]|nr:DciA family protein [Marmoricola sp.]HNI70413.1 DciA family protein [Marmoricola sp.]HNJ79013.1 DciA family protein [Marmoricola sp.]HNN47900.1 DciA family protein [Marmoricola sp.]HNO39993.1 DciA family protein [Marmoricola sp.]